MPLGELIELITNIGVGGIAIAVLWIVVRKGWDREDGLQKRIETLERIVIEQGNQQLQSSNGWRATVDATGEAMRDLLALQQEILRKAELNGLVRRVVEETKRDPKEPRKQ